MGTGNSLLTGNFLDTSGVHQVNYAETPGLGFILLAGLFESRDSVQCTKGSGRVLGQVGNTSRCDFGLSPFTPVHSPCHRTETPI